MPDHVILWRRLDCPGHEACQLSADYASWHLTGTAVFLHEGQSCRLDYAVLCTAAWHTVSAAVAGWIGTRPVQIAVAVHPAGRWHANGVECAAVAGCVDVDLNWSPSTNLLPLRRLDLAIGQEAQVRAAWLGFPSLALEPLEQRYRRLDATTYRYESGGGLFVAELSVNEVGFVTRYPGFCEVETVAG